MSVEKQRVDVCEPAFTVLGGFLAKERKAYCVESGTTAESQEARHTAVQSTAFLCAMPSAYTECARAS